METSAALFGLGVLSVLTIISGIFLYKFVNDKGGIRTSRW